MAGKTPMSGADYGRSLSGLGFNIIVRDVNAALRFAIEVMQAEIVFRTDNFAAMKLAGHDFMIHEIASYRGNALHPTLEADFPCGVGIELRCYEVDPDLAEARARDAGFTVLAGSIDKPHGLRECMILDEDGFVWIPSRRLDPLKT